MDRPSFEQLIKEDRAARESKVWRGTFLEYLDLVRDDPGVPKLAHARLHDTIMRVGTQDIHEADDSRVKRLYKDETFKVYNFFRDEFFGIEKTIAQIVRYFHSASLKGEESRQVLYLMGRSARARARSSRSCSGASRRRRRPTPSKAARCSRSRCTSFPAISGRNSRRCSASTSRATSAPSAASG